MSFTVRAHAAIRAAILADWRARYLAAGHDLDIAQDSDAWSWADAVAFQVEGLEGRAAQLARELFPDTASSAFLERHAAVIGLPRRAATKARLTLAITGTGSWTTSDRLVTSTAVAFVPLAAGSITGSGTVDVEAVSAGTAGNLDVSSALSWSPAPSGITAAATVSAVLVVAREQELDSELAARVLAWWRERPGGGNRSDWIAWAEERAEVGKAFVYPLRHPTLGDGTLGAVTLCVVGPAPTTETSSGEPAASATRLVSAGDLSDLHDQLVGEGDYADEGGLAPATIDPDDIEVSTPAALPTNVTLELVMGSAAPFPFASAQAYTARTTTTITTAALPSGVVTGASVFVAVPDTGVRGGYAYRTATISGSGPYTWTWSGATTVDLPATGNVYPIPSNAADLRAGILAVIDAQGPGVNSAPSARFPAADEGQWPGTLYRSTLVAAAMGVPGLPGAPAGINGVVSATCTLPASDVTATAEQLVTLGTLLLVKAP